MVTDLIVKVFCDVAAFLIGLIPGWTLPSWLTSLPGDASTIETDIGGFNVWLPLSDVVVVLGVIFVATTVAGGIRGARIVASYLTGGGGSVS